MNISCYILDDEFHAIAILKDFISKTPGLELVGSSTAPLTALDEISSCLPVLTFLDIDMPELNGMKFAGLVNSQTTIIFTTAYPEYAVEAFEKEAADYLLKPISYERFLLCIQKIRRNLSGKIQAGNTAQTAFFVKTGISEKLLRINFTDLRYITGADHYIEINLRQQKVITYLTLTEILEKLPAEHFSRIHKSHIVNHVFIQSLEPGQLKLQDQTVLPIGRAYRLAFRKKMQDAFLTSKWHHQG